MEKQLQPPYNLLLAPAQKCHDLAGTEKTMPVDEPDDVVVALGQLDGRNRENLFEAGESGHPATMKGMDEMRETVKLAIEARTQSLNFRFKKAIVAILDSGRITLCRTWKHLILQSSGSLVIAPIIENSARIRLRPIGTI